MANVRAKARKVNVSITTVSRVLNNHPRVNEQMRRRVLAVTNEVGYVATVGRKSTQNIALMYTGEFWLGSPFDAAIMTSLCRPMEESAYDLMVLDARRARMPGETFSSMLRRKGVRGVVLRTTHDTQATCDQIAEEGFPAVVIGDRLTHAKVSYVYSDSRGPSQEAVEHLIGLGHRRIALAVNLIDDSDHADRLEGYRSALSEHGIAFDPKLVIRGPANREGGALLLRRVIASPNPPTALFITDPMMAVGAMSEALSAGIRVPHDLSIVGFDDADARHTTFPKLTAVCQDTAVLGQRAFAILQDLITSAEAVDRTGQPVRKALPTWLEVMDSTAPPSDGRRMVIGRS